MPVKSQQEIINRLTEAAQRLKKVRASAEQIRETQSAGEADAPPTVSGTLVAAPRAQGKP